MLASQAGVALERARLHSRRRTTRDGTGDDRRQADPADPDSIVAAARPRLEFRRPYQAAREVGGDFYDFMNHSIADGRLGLAIADVTGKGVPAGLMMAYSRAVLRAGAMDGAHAGQGSREEQPLDHAASAPRACSSVPFTRISSWTAAG